MSISVVIVWFVVVVGVVVVSSVRVGIVCGRIPYSVLRVTTRVGREAEKWEIRNGVGR